MFDRVYVNVNPFKVKQTLLEQQAVMHKLIKEMKSIDTTFNLTVMNPKVHNYKLDLVKDLDVRRHITLQKLYFYVLSFNSYSAPKTC